MNEAGKKEIPWIVNISVVVGAFVVLLVVMWISLSTNKSICEKGYHSEKIPVWRVCEESVKTGNVVEEKDCVKQIDAGVVYYCVLDGLSMGGTST